MEESKYQDNELLLIDLREGVRAAHTYIFNTYFHELKGYISTICGNDEMAQEIVQQTFIKFWTKRKNLVIKECIKGYLFKMAYNLYRDQQKQKVRELHVIKEIQYRATLEFIENNQNDTEQKIALLNQEIEKLPKKCKIVFLLGKKEGLKYHEIANRLNISTKTVEVHMSKALTRLRNVLYLK
ncbi:RNA polymerase sigma factor [Flagellimonas meridianipacifica]|uniref:RNA polymerase sigma-70 factor (ECF subfamily) n=1 Tax=Flagellimonas meridianipacifica TaxID=1080225 RepID=A0A2T0MBQ5_9FLAO|nr:sigma-70 family RNA polymerase sigma factor [Allomuricauda pacifica]PRX54929.1 RNA polymerase sigma-70 factor (ECF subfamily) [Allomuricauda pacifica]